MEKILEFIWWPLTIMLLPLDGYFIMDCIAKNNFGFNFWFVTIIYILLCIAIGVRLCFVVTRKDN